MITLEVKQDGKIFVIKDCPEKPKFIDTMEYVENCLNQKAMADYQKTLASCERIECADQVMAAELLIKAGARTSMEAGEPLLKPGIYQVGCEWDWEFQSVHGPIKVRKVAILKESPKEESQEEPKWDELRHALQLIQNRIEAMNYGACGTYDLKEAWNLISDFITTNERIT